MATKNVSDTQQNPEMTESTEHEENDDEETMLSEASTDQNALLQALTMRHTELKDFKQGMRRDLVEFKNNVKKVLKDDLAEFKGEGEGRAKTLT